MPNLAVKRSDRFPPGTTVGAYLLAGRHEGGKPSGSAAASAEVASNGTLTISVTSGVPYVLYAEVSGEHRYLTGRIDSFTAPGTLRERITARRTAVGAT